jgi:hypothetical protein
MRVAVELRSGSDEGETTSFTIGEAPTDAKLSVGDGIRAFRNPVPENAVIGGVRVDRYGFSDYERRGRCSGSRSGSRRS